MSTAQPIEVQAWQPDNSAMIAVLQDASSARWTDLLADVGSGSVELSWYDPKATVAVTQAGSLIKFLLGGVPDFAFFNDSPVLTIAEASASKWVLAGQSVLSYLGRADAYMPGGVAAPTALGYSFNGATPGTILKTLIDAAQLRGSGLKTISALTYDFTATLDSAGNAWAAAGNLTIAAGATILDVAKQLVAKGMGLAMDTNLALHAYVPGAQGTNLTGTVVWREGAHIVSPVSNVGNRTGLSSVCLVQGAGGKFIETTDPAYTENPYVGRRESSLDLSGSTGDTTQMTAAGNQQILLTETASQALTVSVNHGSSGLYEPYQDYHVGDTIALDVPGSYAMAPWQIVGLTVAQTSAAGYDIDANLGSIALPLDLRLARQASNVAGTGSPISGSIAGNLTLGSPKGLRYVPLTTGYIQAVADASSTGASIAQTHTAEMTALPAAGVVAVQVQIFTATSSASLANACNAWHYGDSASTPTVRAYCGGTANFYAAASGMVMTGGTNNRMIDYSVARAAGTITYYIQVIGYWIGA
jgi:hypothetical protein